MGIPDKDVLAQILLEVKAIHKILKDDTLAKDLADLGTIVPDHIKEAYDKLGADILDPSEIGFFKPFNEHDC